jgi:hypothetical protein
LELYEAEGRNTKFIPVVFSSQDADYIPHELRAATRYDLSAPEGYDNPFRHLTDPPARKKSAVAPQISAMPTGSHDLGGEVGMGGALGLFFGYSTIARSRSLAHTRALGRSASPE